MRRKIDCLMRKVENILTITDLKMRGSRLFVVCNLPFCKNRYASEKGGLFVERESRFVDFKLLKS